LIIWGSASRLGNARVSEKSGFRQNYEIKGIILVEKNGSSLNEYVFSKI
jgi:hypothetical protein